jgi:mRNA interferase RelE/StbE
MEIFLHESAEKFLSELDKKIQKNIKDHLKKLSEDPHSKRLDIKKLKGLHNRPDVFRLRVGEYRMIYLISDNKIWITEIIRREGAYDF